MKDILIRAIVPILIIVVGWMGMQYLAHLKKPPQKRPPVHEGPLVEVMKVRVEDHRVNLLLTGQVEPKYELRVVPEVTGRVVWVNPGFERGGFFEKGEPFFKVDSLAYEAQKARALEALEAARRDFEQVSSEARVAREEWKRLNGKNPPPSPLVLYGPQLQSARARLDAARLAYEKAVQDLARTNIRAPFACVVADERIEIGGYVRAGEEVARVIGTDSVEVRVPLTLHDFQLLGGDAGGPGARARIALWGPQKEYDFLWDGTVERILPSVDEKDRMYQAVLTVKDPFQLQGPGPLPGRQAVQLRIKQFVRCLIQGVLLEGVVPLPERALKDQGYVWRVGASNMLEIVPVDVVDRMRGEVFVRGDISDGDLIVLSGITGAANGLKVRPVEVTEGPGQ